MISVIITAFREAGSVGRAIDALLPQLPPESELLVVCPDPETTQVVRDYAARFPAVRHVCDPQQGKPTALNRGLAAARGDLVVLTDGDVYAAPDALAPLLAPFDDPGVGAVSGQPLPLNRRDTLLGYWSHWLTHAAHVTRLRRDAEEGFLVCSGYLYAFRRTLAGPIPAEALAEDAYVSHRVAEQGYRVRYAPDAYVYVRFPTHYRDWLRQKVRSAGGYAQDYVRRSPVKMRTPALELAGGLRLGLTYPQRPRERWWTLLLFLARLHLWVLVWLQVRLLRRPLLELWQRVETTK